MVVRSSKKQRRKYIRAEKISKVKMLSLGMLKAEDGPRVRATWQRAVCIACSWN